MMKKDLYSNLSFEPGLYLEEVLEELEMSREELDDSIRQPLSVVQQVISGEQEISEELAVRLETAVGVPAVTWRHLEEEYRSSC